MKPVIQYPTFARQRKQIKSQVEDIYEEIEANENLIIRLRKHTNHLLQIINVSSSVLFPSVFAEAYSSLSKFNQILTEINCKLEVLTSNEISQWNSMCTKYISSSIKPFIWDNNEGKDNKNDFVKCHSVNPKLVQKTPAVAPLKSNNSANCLSCKAVNNGKNSKPNLQSLKVNVEQIKKVKCASGKNKMKTETVEAKNKSKVCSIVKKKKKSKKSCSALTGNNKTTVICNKSKLDVSEQEKEQNLEARHAIENTKLLFNIRYKGYITLLVSPLEFYTHFLLENMQEKFGKFMEEMESYCKNYQFPASKPKGKTIALRKQLVAEKLGEFALLYLQPAFHRVKIKNWNLTKNDDTVTVDLLDMGGIKNVSLYNLHPIPTKLMKYPAFASRCHLAGVPKDVGQITRIVDFFRSWVNKTKHITVVISEEKSSVSPESLPVIIYDDATDSPVNELINSRIQDNQKKIKESVEKWDPMSEAYNSNLNMYDFDVDDPAASIYGYVGKDYDRVCKLYGNTGKCYKKACRKEHVLLDSKGFTTDKEEIYIRALNPLKIPKAKVINVRLTHIESPSSFYCTLDTPESDTTEENLVSLHSYMNESQNISEMKKMLTPPAVGQVVVAQFPKNKSWFRAKVISVLPEKDECTLFYVDHGSVASANFSCIRAIEPRYLHLPFQAIFCEICGIGDQQETSDLAVRYIKENLNAVSRVEVVSTLPGEQPHLLVNLYTSQGENVAKKLLLHKLVACKENIFLDESKVYLPG